MANTQSPKIGNDKKISYLELSEDYNKIKSINNLIIQLRKDLAEANYNYELIKRTFEEYIKYNETVNHYFEMFEDIQPIEINAQKKETYDSIKDVMIPWYEDTYVWYDNGILHIS